LPEWNIHRVAEGVAQGGHNVPDEDVRRRYVRSLANASRALRIVHEGLVFDNSGSQPRLIFEMRAGQVLHIADEIPAWAAALLEDPRGQK
jgi:predicted ABC-type ATPase